MKTLQIRVLFDRKGQATTKTSALVQLEVRYDKQRKFIGTGIKVYKGQFKNGRIVGRADADSLNDKINALCRKVNDIYTECLNTQCNFTLSMLDNHTSDKTGASFIDFIIKRTEEKRSATSTYRQNKILINLLEMFGGIRTFADITLPNVRTFDDWLKAHKGIKTGKPLQGNSIKSYHARLRSFINEAITYGIIKENPYTQFKQGRFKTQPRTYLTMDELHTLRTWTPPTPAYHKALDLFIVQCYTGLSYSDLMNTDFTKTEEHDGTLIIPRTTRIKTGTQYYMMLLPPVIEILERNNWQLPKISLTYYGNLLASIGKYTGIDKNLTSHVGRHTFATTIALGSGIPIEVVSKMLGHTNIQTTQIYAKILPKQVMDGFAKIKEVVH
jgi:integrase